MIYIDEGKARIAGQAAAIDAITAHADRLQRRECLSTIHKFERRAIERASDPKAARRATAAARDVARRQARSAKAVH